MKITQIAALGVAAFSMASTAHADHGGAGTGPDASGPITGLSAHTSAKGSLAFGLDMAIATPDHRSNETLRSLAGKHIHAHDQNHSETYTLGASYGLGDNLSLSATLPVIRRIAIREGSHAHVSGVTTNSVIDRGDSQGLGDAALSVKWRFTGEHHHGWEAALLAGLKLPTGRTNVIDDQGERFEPEHQPGSGSWDPILGMALTRPLPRGSFSVSVVHQIALSGSQKTRLGDRSRISVSLTQRLIGPKIDYHGIRTVDAKKTAVDGLIELSGEREGRVREDGITDVYTGARAAFLSTGLRVGRGQWSVGINGSLPLSQHVRLSHSETASRLRLSFGRSF